MRRLVLICGALIALALALTWRAGERSAADGPAAGAPRAEAPAAGAELRAPGAAAAGRSPLGAPAPAPEAVPETAPAPRPSLLDLLAELADAEEAAMRGAVPGAAGVDDPAAVERVTRAVAAILAEPAHVWAVIGLLESGEARAQGERGERAGWSRFDDLTRIEYAACRALYWAIVGYNDPGGGENPFLGRADGRAVLLDVVACLPRVGGAAGTYLLACVGEARYRATGLPVLDRTCLADLLALRAAFADHEALFWTLLGIVKESMTPEEIRALDAVVADPVDPTAAAEKLAALFESGDPAIALLVAGQSYAAAASDAVRQAVAGAVVAHADELEAAEFLAERVEDAKGWTDLWLTLGRRERGSDALDATYAALAADALAGGGRLDPERAERARELCVTGMIGASAERLLEIFDRESSPRIRGQALLTLTFRDGYATEEEHLVLVERGLVDGSIDPAKGVSAAYTMTAKAPRGSPERAAGLELLKRIAESSSSARAREHAATWLAELD